MKIAIDCRQIGQSGIGTFIENVLRHLVSYKDHNFVLIGDTRSLCKFSKFANCSIVECNFSIFTLKELVKYPVKEVNKCDAFYTPNFNIPMGIKVPIFSTIHDIVFLDTPNFCSSVKQLIYKWYIKRALRISKTIFTVSEFSKKRILDYFKSNKDLCVINNGINQELIDYKYSHNTVTKKSGIVFLGNLKKHKGIQLLLEAYQKMKVQDGSDIPLTIIGKFNFRSRDEAIINILKENKLNIKFISNASNQEVYEIISASAVLVSPSYYEGFGIPPLEALFLDTNVIISDIPVYKEIYSDYPVIFFQSGNANSLYQSLRNFSYKKIDVSSKAETQYNYKKTASNILKLIQDW